MAEASLRSNDCNNRLDADEADEAAALVESLQDYPNWYSPFAIAKLDVIQRFFSLTPSDSLCRCLMDGTKLRVGVNGSDKSPHVRIFTSHFLGLPPGPASLALSTALLASSTSSPPNDGVLLLTSDPSISNNSSRSGRTQSRKSRRSWRLGVNNV